MAYDRIHLFEWDSRRGRIEPVLAIEAAVQGVELSAADEYSIQYLRCSINGDTRSALFQRPDSKLVFKNISNYGNSSLEFGIALNPVSWNKRGTGVLFEITVIDPDHQQDILFSKRINPKHNPEDRKWHNCSLSLSKFRNQKISLVFTTHSEHIGVWPLWSNLYIKR